MILKLFQNNFILHVTRALYSSM